MPVGAAATEELQKALKDGRLQDVIRQIDAAPNPEQVRRSSGWQAPLLAQALHVRQPSQCKAALDQKLDWEAHGYCGSL